MRERTRKPTTPGEILKEEFLVPLGLTQGALARHIRCDIKVINRIVNGSSRVSVPMAFKLGAAFGTTPGLWLNLQRSTDEFEFRQSGVSLPTALISTS